MIAGALEIQLLANMAQLRRDMGEAKSTLTGAVAQMNRTLAGFGVGFSAAGVLAGMAAMVRASEEAELAQRKLDATLRATGNATGYTAAQLSALADKLAKASTFDDEGFRTATATLVRFGNIGGQNLERVLKLSADYAALTGGDLVSAAETLGRALSSPAEGLGKLERHFGDLGKETEAAIKLQAEMGNSAGALGLAIDALEKKIGGSDATINQGLTGSLKGLRKALNELMEAGGKVADNNLVTATIDAIAASLRGVKSVLEGDWSLKLMTLLNLMHGRGGQFLAGLGNLGVGPVTPGPAGGGSFSLADQDERALKALAEILKWRKQLEEDAQRERDRRLREAAAAELKVMDEIALAQKLGAEAEIRWSREAAEAKEQIRKDELEGQGALARQAAKIAEEEARQIEQLRVSYAVNAWNEIGDAFAGFAVSFMDGWKGAMDYARRLLRQLVAEMIAIFAKRWILQIGAGMVGGSAGAALAGQAASLGEGTFAGGLLSSFGALLPSGAIGTAFSNVAQMGAGALGLSGSLGSSIGSFASFLPGIGSLIAIGSILYSLFKDGPENPEFRLLQGTGGAGAFGGISTQGNFAMGAQWEQLLAYVGGLDARFSRLLGAEGSAAASARLAAYTGTGLRSDGQPATFGIPPGSEAAGAEQIARELLQSRYGILFEGIDKGIADQIREWKGTSTDLQAFIEQMLGIIEGLAGSGIKGFDITALRAMQREGEDLGQTFQRVGSQWAQFNELFTTDAERLAAARELIAKTFGDLGLAVPASAQAFEDLVRGLDLSTEAGRKMFEALLEVAPAFASVSRAAEEAWAEVQGLIGRITGTAPGGGFAGAVSAFQAGNAWAAGLSGAALVQQLLTITEQDFQNYSEANQALIKQILRLYEGMGELSTAAGAAAGGLASIGEMVPGNQYGTKMGIQNYLMSLLTGEQASPLTLAQRTQIAGSDFQRLLARAQAGDWSAMEQLQGSAQTYLGLAREQFASSPAYNAIFQQVFTALQGVSGFHLDWQGQLVNAGAATNEKLDQLNDQLGNLLGLIASGQQTGDTAVAQAVRDSAREIVEELRAGEPGLVT